MHQWFGRTSYILIFVATIFASGCLPDVSNTPPFDIFVSADHHFEFSYLGKSSIREEEHENYSYLRIQNYASNDREYSLLEDGMYYLEVFIFDHQKNQSHKIMDDGVIIEGCENILPQAVPVVISGHPAYMSDEDLYEGGGDSRVLCFNLDRKDIYMRVVEAYGSDHEHAEHIFGTFRFTQ